MYTPEIQKSTIISFGELSTKETEIYSIPKQYLKIELEKNDKEFKSFKALMAVPKTQDIYVSLMKAMIFLEEAAVSASLRQFDFDSVMLKIHNKKDQTLEIVEADVSKMYLFSPD